MNILPTTNSQNPGMVVTAVDSLTTTNLIVITITKFSVMTVINLVIRTSSVISIAIRNLAKTVKPTESELQ